jgi:hypothetical protein
VESKKKKQKRGKKSLSEFFEVAKVKTELKRRKKSRKESEK